MGSPDGVRNERSNPSAVLITRRVFSRFMAGRGLEYTTAAFLLAAGALQLPRILPPHGAGPSGLNPSMSTEQLVLATAQTWEVSRSNDEVEDWRGAYPKPATASVNMIPGSELLLAQVCFADTLRRMAKSQNPLFFQAGNEIKNLVELGLLDLSWGLTNDKVGSSYDFNDQGELSFTGMLGLDFTLNESSSPTLGTALTEMFRRFSLYRVFNDKLPLDLPPLERSKAFQQRFTDPEQMLTDYALSLGHAIQAYIYHCGLMGSALDLSLSSYSQLTRDFILYGQSPDSPKWIDYLKGSNSSS